MPIPKWKKKSIAVWHVHGPIVIAVGLATVCAAELICALEWMFSQ